MRSFDQNTNDFLIDVNYESDGLNEFDSGKLISEVESIEFALANENKLIAHSYIVSPEKYYKIKLRINIKPKELTRAFVVKDLNKEGTGYLEGVMLDLDADIHGFINTELWVHLLVEEGTFKDLYDRLFQIDSFKKNKLRFEANVLGMGNDCKWVVSETGQIGKLLIEDFSFNLTKF